MTSVFLVTGAAGKTGMGVIQALIAKGESVRALVFRDNQVAFLNQLGVKEVVVGNMLSQESVNEAVADVRAIYHICPNMHPDEFAIGQIVVAAAKSAGCERFVYHSVLHPQIQAMPHHWHKLLVEGHIFESGLACTILQPAAYMQNILANWHQILTDGIYAVPYAAETRLSMVDLQDVVEAAVTVMTEPGYEGATYELSGPDFLNQKEVAAILETQLNRSVSVREIRIAAWQEQAKSNGLGDYQIDTVSKMFLYYERYGFRGNPKALEMLLGRTPGSFAEFVRRNL